MRRYPDLARDPLAAAVAAMALRIDTDQDAPSAAVFLKLMGELRRMLPEEQEESKVDELQRRRAAKMGAAGA